MEKIVGILKPKGITSHDVVHRLRQITGEKTIGHAGTLDPLATGVLVVGIGREATKKLREVVAKEKEYIATVRFGEESTTDDEEGEKKRWDFKTIPSRADIEAACKKFEGKISQTPPAYSAVKVKGKESYKWARRGETLSLEPREVFIKSIAIEHYEWPFLTLRVATGPGVYIRALARDLGRELNVGGYIAELERVRVGEFTKENSCTLEQFNSHPPRYKYMVIG